MSDATTGLPNAKATFERALGHITGPRRTSYGPVRESFERAALAWSGILGTTITAEQVVLCMAGYKLTREANAHSGDNIDDACGYLGLLAELQSEPRPDQSAFSKHCADVDARLREESQKLRASLILHRARAAQNSYNGYHDCSTPPPTAL